MKLKSRKTEKSYGGGKELKSFLEGMENPIKTRFFKEYLKGYKKGPIKYVVIHKGQSDIVRYKPGYLDPSLRNIFFWISSN